MPPKSNTLVVVVDGIGFLMNVVTQAWRNGRFLFRIPPSQVPFASFERTLRTYGGGIDPPYNYFVSRNDIHDPPGTGPYEPVGTKEYVEKKRFFGCQERTSPAAGPSVSPSRGRKGAPGLAPVPACPPPPFGAAGLSLGEDGVPSSTECVVFVLSLLSRELGKRGLRQQQAPHPLRGRQGLRIPSCKVAVGP